MSETKETGATKPVEVRLFNPITIHALLCATEKVNELASLLGAQVVINTFTQGIVLSLTTNNTEDES